MTLSLYDASIPGYLNMLRNLAALLDKAEAHAKATGADLSTYLEARLAPDMHTLVGQIQLAIDAAKSGAARLAGVASPTSRRPSRRSRRGSPRPSPSWRR